MSSTTPTYTLRPRARHGAHKQFLQDTGSLDRCRTPTTRRCHPAPAAERTEQTVTMTSKRVTMQLPRSTSRLSKQSSSLSLSSSVSTDSSLGSRRSSFLMRDPSQREECSSPIVPYTGYQGSKCPNCDCDRGAVNCHCDDDPHTAPFNVSISIGSSRDSLDSRDSVHTNHDTSIASEPAYYVHSGNQSGISRSTSGLHRIHNSASTGYLEEKGNSSTLPRAASSKLAVTPKAPPLPASKSWTTSLSRGNKSPLPVHSPKRTSKALRNVLSAIFGHGNNKALSVAVEQPQIKDELAEVTQEMEGLDLADGFTNLGIHEEKQNPKSTMLLVGKKKFNMDPKKGLEYLIENGLLRNTPEDISEFLYKGEGLSKRAIGDYLGEKNDFNILVLKAFVNLHEFSDMLIVQALRQFLWSFRLPGEAQKIDRMMECFAQRYCELNPQHFSTTDTCYVLSFAIIMLNTSLHNPAVKDKPSVERFIDMNRGINDGKDLPVDLLTRVYDNIKKEPFKIPEDDGDDLIHTFFNPDKEGWLWKQASGRCGRYKTWKRRWFLLKDHCLYYFEFTQDKEPKGIIPLENIQIREANDRDKPNCFELYAVNNDVIKACKTNTDGKVVEGKHTVYRMSASSSAEKEQWMKTIREMIKSDTPFYSILAARRKKAQHE